MAAVDAAGHMGLPKKCRVELVDVHFWVDVEYDGVVVGGLGVWDFVSKLVAEQL